MTEDVPVGQIEFPSLQADLTSGHPVNVPTTHIYITDKATLQAQISRVPKLYL